MSTQLSQDMDLDLLQQRMIKLMEELYIRYSATFSPGLSSSAMDSVEAAAAAAEEGTQMVQIQESEKVPTSVWLFGQSRLFSAGRIH